jgi:multidrug resistance protein, MATE family
MKQFGDSYKQILHYWWPEMISGSIIFILPMLLDAMIVAQLRSTSTYGALGIANTFLHMITKMAESISVATVAVVGHFNGAKKYKKAWEALGDSFWSTIFVGFIPFILIFSFSTQIYMWLGTPEHIAQIGSPYLKLRAVGVLLSFIYLGFFGFLRGVKNTKTPMQILVSGIMVFLFFDYALVLGKFGFPQLKLVGSATATIIQFSIMIIICMIYILKNKEYKLYFSKAFFRLFNLKGALHILNISWPIAIDKTALASCYIYLNKLINPMGKYAIASYSVVKDLERFAMLPGIAFATVITLLVSNRLGAKDKVGARANIRKVLQMAGIMVSIILLIICFNTPYFLKFFDLKNKFAPFAAKAFPFISILVIFDFIQLILSGVLRGAGDVRALMIIRVFGCVAFFYPVATLLSKITYPSDIIRFIFLYGSFYLYTGFIGLLCILRLKWKRVKTDKI